MVYDFEELEAIIDGKIKIPEKRQQELIEDAYVLRNVLKQRKSLRQ